MKIVLGPTFFSIHLHMIVKQIAGNSGDHFQGIFSDTRLTEEWENCVTYQIT